MFCTCPHCQQSFELVVPERKVMELKLAIFILNSICQRFHVTEAEIKSRSRLPEIAKARHIAAFLIYKYCGYSVTTTGHLIHRHWTSVIHAQKRCVNAYATKMDIYQDLVELSKEVEEILEPQAARVQTPEEVIKKYSKKAA